MSYEIVCEDCGVSGSEILNLWQLEIRLRNLCSRGDEYGGPVEALSQRQEKGMWNNHNPWPSRFSSQYFDMLLCRRNGHSSQGHNWVCRYTEDEKLTVEEVAIPENDVLMQVKRMLKLLEKQVFKEGEPL